jgi:hypothetical protein
LTCDGLEALCDPHAIAGGARFQVAMGRRGVIVVDGFAARDWLRGIEAFGDDSRVRVGGRAELVVKF